MTDNLRIAVIGGGNMGAAIASGVVSGGIVAADRVVVSHLKSGQHLPEGVRTTRDNVEAVEGADLVVVAVKPWLLQEVLAELAPHIDPCSQAVVSVVAGVDFTTLAEWLSGAKSVPALFRVIPNTAVSVGRSVTFVAESGASDAQREIVGGVFGALGRVYNIREEQMQAATALASCGIAYALRYIDASCKAGVESGIEPQMALDVVMETVQGAVSVLRHSGASPQSEIDRVTTPGGITLRGLEAMERAGFSAAVAEGIKASK